MILILKQSLEVLLFFSFELISAWQGDSPVPGSQPPLGPAAWSVNPSAQVTPLLAGVNP